MSLRKLTRNSARLEQWRKDFFLFFILFSIAVPLNAATADKAVAKFVKSIKVPGNSVAVKIIDLSDKSVIGSHNTDEPLIPASILKSITSATLLDFTGPDWTYHTRVYIDGPNDLGYLRGNVIIEGACDPTVNSEHEPISPDIIEEICQALSAQLINRIEGEIIIDETSFKGPSRHDSWAAGDRKKYYGTGSHAFNFSDNARGDFSVENPSYIFSNALKSALENNGIELEGKSIMPGERIQILDHHSAPIDEIMRSCMMRSDNQFAESLLRTYGKLKGGDGSTKEAAETEFNLWKERNLPLEGVKIVDGSGLSRNNRVTANFMAAVLSEMSSNSYYASFFPLAGQEGTLKKFLSETPLDSYIAMKTGSMTGIQCYAGYKLDDDYVPTHVIVIIMNQLPKNRKRAIEAAENMLLEIFADNESL